MTGEPSGWQKAIPLSLPLFTDNEKQKALEYLKRQHEMTREGNVLLRGTNDGCIAFSRHLSSFGSSHLANFLSDR